MNQNCNIPFPAAGRIAYSANSFTDCSASLAGSYSRGVSLVRNTDPYAALSWKDRTAVANTWHFHLIAVECVLADYLNNYVYQLEQLMKEAGLMRHRMKKCMTDLTDASRQLYRMVNKHGRIQVKVFCSPMYAPLADDYHRDGGELIKNIIAEVKQMEDLDITRLYFCTKNMINRTKCPHADIATNLQMLLLLTNTDLEFFEVVSQRVKALVGDRISYTVSDTNAKVLKAVRTIYELLFSAYDEEVNQKDVNDVRTLARMFQEKLVGEEMTALMEKQIWMLRGNFMLYVLLRLAMRQQNGGVERRDLKHLLVRMGSRDKVVGLLRELGQVALPEECDTDICEALQEFDLPKEKGSLMEEFYRLSLEDKVLYRQESDLRTRYCRTLRRMIYTSRERALSPSMLTFLYHLLHTKKAVLSLLTDAGPEVMGKTIRRFRGMTAASMQRPDGRYYFNFGAGLERLRQEKGLTAQDMAQMMSLTKSQYDVFGRLTSFTAVDRTQLREWIAELGQALRVDTRHYLFLCIEPTDKEGVAVCSFDYVLMRGFMVYLGLDPEKGGGE